MDRKRARELEIWLQQRFPGRRITRLGKTKLCLEGFPRSGNSLLCRKVLATSSYGRPELAHHIHLRQNIECAVLAGIPTIAAVREPLECMTSYLVYTGGRDHENMFVKYREILALIIARSESIAIALFDEIVSDYASVTSRANRIFGEILHSPTMSDEDLNKMLTDQVKRENFHRESSLEKIGAPDSRRNTKKAEFRSYVESHAAFAGCVVAYRKVVALAERQ